jgi:hypothetical protein
VCNQLEKSITGKLEATLAKQIQMQFHTSGRQALQVSIFLYIDVVKSADYYPFNMACFICLPDINIFAVCFRFSEMLYFGPFVLAMLCLMIGFKWTHAGCFAY